MSENEYKYYNKYNRDIIGMRGSGVITKPLLKLELGQARAQLKGSGS